MTAVAIIGAGYAGLACAVELALQEVEVTVFERSRTMGGRARAVHKDGWTLDNGQHLLSGAYTELMRLLRLTGVSPRRLECLPLTLHIPGQLHFRAASLPAPLHLLAGLVRAHGLGWRDSFAIALFLHKIKHTQCRLPEEMTVAHFLEKNKQTPRLCRLIWEPLCLAALNTPAIEASARIFANVLRDTLAANSSASELLIPRIDLSELFPVPAARTLATRNGNVLTGNPITGITPDGTGFRLTGAPGQRIWPHVVIATAPHHAVPLLESTGACAPLAAQIAALPNKAIATVYIHFDEGIRLPAPMMGLTGHPAQWAFDRGQSGGPVGLMAMVISDSPTQENGNALAAESLAQLEQALGRKLPAPLWAQTIIEKRATFACRPGVARPDITTPLPGLWLVGDYIESEYPATLESAVRSGVRCAREILG
ncbi:MAG: hydroxysqualene dehydroxylase HpnE, partial [Azoarcus sp.]|nr:hydroxysqualene dehydroxylase HpnE [Azoarcus sp.]